MRLRLLMTVILLTGLGSAGCSTAPDIPQQPDPTTPAATVEPTSEPVPTEEPLADGEAEVVQVYKDFTVAYDTVLQTGDGNVSPVSPFLRGEARTSVISFIGAAADEGIVQEGSVTVDAVTVESYDDGPGGSAQLRACIDASTYVFVKDGEEVRERGGQVVSYVTLKEQDGAWMIDSTEPRPDETC